VEAEKAPGAAERLDDIAIGEAGEEVARFGLERFSEFVARRAACRRLPVPLRQVE